MPVTRSRVNSYGEWWEVAETFDEIIEELQSLDEEDWVRLTDSVTGDPLWLKARGIACVASAWSEYEEAIEELMAELSYAPQSTCTVIAVPWRYVR